MNSYSKKEAIEILQRALNKKDSDQEPGEEMINSEDLESMAAELHITKSQLEQAVTEIRTTTEKRRGDIFPQAVTTRWIKGRLTDQEVEEALADIRHEFGGSNRWGGKPVKPHKIGKIWEYDIENAKILLREESDGYSLQVIKYQFFHGTMLEAGVLAVPVAFLLGVLPVAAAYEWIHLYAAIITALTIYSFSCLITKKYAQKKRSGIVSRLLEITEFAEQKIKATIEKQRMDLPVSDEKPHSREERTQDAGKNKLR